ncbi:MAG: hypothetical protein FJW34_15800 [Acidobacteria bacterium]|nr:hypothetical protein [Acidobacteriota bacterium]
MENITASVLEPALRNPAGIRVADQAWIATALLHREHPKRHSFSFEEIVERAGQEHWSAEVPPGVRHHISYHAVASLDPNPSDHRMLHATGRGFRRLYRPGDPVHPLRKGKILPRRDQIPSRYHYLLEWYEREYARSPANGLAPPDPILALLGLGAEIWQTEDPDEFVRRLREGWE